jgi:hypothetical protein
MEPERRGGMAESTIREEIIRQLDNLTPDEQQQVLDFAKSLQNTLPPGIPGEVLIARAREVDFDPADLAEGK